MSFEEKISALAEKVPGLVDHLETEEATKTALVMPFLAALGYDIFDPTEVVPEFTADVGTKKGEKVDYAVMQNGEMVMLIEVKKAGCDLQTAAVNQLYRYFTVTKARIAVVTNGIHYRFFSDLEEPNRMDSRPFLELDLLDLRDGAVSEVAKLSKDSFDLDRMLSSAHELMFTNDIKRILGEQWEAPHEDLVRFFFLQMNPGGRFVAKAKEQFTPLVRRALQQFISERVSGRLRSALEQEGRSIEETRATADEEPMDDGIITTEEELEGFHMVKAIVSQVVDPDRVVHRDTKSYMGVLLDDNNRKPICRLWFNRKQRYVGTFDDQKREQRVPIESLKDIYLFSDLLRDTVLRYETGSEE